VAVKTYCFVLVCFIFDICKSGIVGKKCVEKLYEAENKSNDIALEATVELLKKVIDIGPDLQKEEISSVIKYMTNNKSEGRDD